MSTRLALTVVGTFVGAYFGYPQLGAMAGAMIGSAVDPTTIQGPRIGETRTQTAAEGVPRPVFFGVFPCAGNIIDGERTPRIIETSTRQGKGGTKVKSEKAIRTYAIGVCEGPATILVVKQDGKIVYDIRPGSPMIAESTRWASNKIFYSGDESQLPDPHLEAMDPDAPAHRGTCYWVAVDDDVTKMSGAISQFECIVARSVTPFVSTVAAGPNNGGYVSYIYPTEDGNVLMLRDQTNGFPEFTVGNPGSWTVAEYSRDNINTMVDFTVFANGGDAIDPTNDQRMGVLAIDDDGYAIASAVNSAPCRLLHGGATQAYLRDEGGNLGWWYGEFGNSPFPQYGGLIFFRNNRVYLGYMRSGLNKMVRYNNYKIASGNSVLPSAYINNPIAAGRSFFMHVSRQETVRIIDTATPGTIREYDENFALLGTRTVPSAGWLASSECLGFGFDDARGMQVYLYKVGTNITEVDIYDLSGNHMATRQTLYVAGSNTKVEFTDKSIFFQRNHTIYSIDVATFSGGNAVLSEIVDWLHRRCNFPASEYDTSELTDTVRGFGMASSGYTAADAIDSLRLAFFFDKSCRDGKLYYPKRGKASAKTLQFADLTTATERNGRKQTQEIPYKVNLSYISPDANYAQLTQPAGSNSPDRRTTGEVTLDMALCFNATEAAQIADKQYKTMLAEVDGELEFSTMLDAGLDLADADPFGYAALDGALNRNRIETMEFDNYALRITAKADRQSAYTSALTGIDPPTPTAPPSTIVGETEFVIIDGPRRTDSEDRIGLLTAVSGALPPWWAAQVQRSLDGGASYTPAADIEGAATMGVLLDPIANASEYLTDRTNQVHIRLYREGQTLDSLTSTQFLSQQGVFALEKADGSFEYMQALDWAEQLDGSFIGTTLHRGLASSNPSAHSAGARFVMLADAVFMDASSAWIGTALTHRAVSYDESEDETDNDETRTYLGRNQIERPIASLRLTRSGSTVSGAWNPRHSLGSDDNPVPSGNAIGYRVTITDGVTPEIFDTTTPSFTRTFASPVTVTVGALNRITGLGPTTSGSI